MGVYVAAEVLKEVRASGEGGGNDRGSSSSAIKMLFYYYHVVAGKTRTKIPVAAAINSDTVLSALAKDNMAKGFSERKLLKIGVAVSADVYFTHTLAMDTIRVKKQLKDKRSK